PLLTPCEPDNRRGLPGQADPRRQPGNANTQRSGGSRDASPDPPALWSNGSLHLFARRAVLARRTIPPRGTVLARPPSSTVAARPVSAITAVAARPVSTVAPLAARPVSAVPALAALAAFARRTLLAGRRAGPHPRGLRVLLAQQHLPRQLDPV